jgi:WD and tetratricopeptide repeat-containing protein 1
LPEKQKDYRRKYRTLASTYVTFGPNGNELLVNLGGEQIYLFDINKRHKPQRFDPALRQKLDSAGVFPEMKGRPFMLFSTLGLFVVGCFKTS